MLLKSVSELQCFAPVGDEEGLSKSCLKLPATAARLSTDNIQNVTVKNTKYDLKPRDKKLLCSFYFLTAELFSCLQVILEGKHRKLENCIINSRQDTNNSG